MHKDLIAITTIAIALTVSNIALAQSAKESKRAAIIGQTTINLTLLNGYCFLDENQPSDSNMLTAMANTVKGRNRLLAGFAKCNQLQSWRTGKRPLLDHHGNFQTFLRTENQNLQTPRDAMAEAVCAQFRKNKINVGKILGDTKKRVEQSVPGVKVNEQKFLGEIETTANACYAGIYQKFNTPSGSVKSQLGVFATLLVNGKFVYIYLFAPEAGILSMKALIKDSKRLVSKLLTANDR